MAGPYYVDPAGSNTSPYDTWAKAATSLQTIADIIAAGETCYMRGTQSISAAIDFDTAAATGSNAAGFVSFIGCNSEGNVDGTRFKLDLTAGCHGINANGNMDLVWLENIEIDGNDNAGNYDGISMSASSRGWVLNNVAIHNMGRHGIGAYNYDEGGTYIRCTSYLNGSSGIYASHMTTARYFCSYHDNTGDGADACNGLFDACLVYDNGDDGAYSNGSMRLFNCVIDQNADDGFLVNANTGLYLNSVIGCRITNQSGDAADVGLNANSENVVYGWNYIFHNGDNLANDTLLYAINVNGVDTNTVATEDSGNVDADGYTSITDGSEDYNLASDATLRRTAITIPTS